MSMDTRKEVLFVLIQEYADWEFALLAPGLRRGFGVWEPRYEVRTVAADEGPVRSIGGCAAFRIIPSRRYPMITPRWCWWAE